MRADGAASVPGLHWPPEKPTAMRPRSCGEERNLEGIEVVGKVVISGWKMSVEMVVWTGRKDVDESLRIVAICHGGSKYDGMEHGEQRVEVCE